MLPPRALAAVVLAGPLLFRVRFEQTAPSPHRTRGSSVLKPAAAPPKGATDVPSKTPSFA